jgi:syntaxin 12/13
MASYAAAGTPKGGEAERYNALVQETSKAIGAFNQATRSITQKMSLFGTPQDSRANHQELKELSDKGNKLVTKINRRLQDLTKLCTGPAGRTRKTQVNKLASDFKNQCKAFEDVCQRLVEQEKTAVAHIRRSSSLVRHEDAHGLGDYSEDQIYAQANVTSYDEDGACCLLRRLW